MSWPIPLSITTSIRSVVIMSIAVVTVVYVVIPVLCSMSLMLYYVVCVINAVSCSMSLLLYYVVCVVMLYCTNAL